MRHFIATDHLRRIDADRSPLEGAPALAVEVVSPGNSDQDMRKEVSQYLAAGSKAVWVVYPAIRLIEIPHSSRTQKVEEPGPIIETTAFADLQFSLSLSDIFDS